MRSLLPFLACAACSPGSTRPGPDATPTDGTVHTVDTAAPEPDRFGFPLEDPTLVSVKIGVDHDPTEQTGGFDRTECVDYLGRPFPYCYDQHDGSDFVMEGGFDRMDAGSLAILAAKDGVVIDTHDGEYDRCHIEGGDVSCDGYAMEGNQVTIEHADGFVTKYWHMKTASVAVSVGDVVHCGDPIGLVGSSGYSSMPHLHFEVVRPDGVVVDPFTDPDGAESSLWDEQFPEPIMPGPGCTADDAG